MAPIDRSVQLTEDMQAAWKLIHRNEHIILTTHERADGDGFGALLALGHVFEQLGKQVHRVVKDGAPESLAFLTGQTPVTTHMPLLDRTSSALIIVMDASELNRTGLKDEILALRELRHLDIIDIDHHPHGELFGNVNLVNEFASSTCELAYDLLALEQISIDMFMANALLTGIFTDTGSFQHSNTNPHALHIASELVAKGARLNKISKQLYSNKQESALHIWGETLSRVKVLPQFGLAVSIITQDDLKKYHASIDDASGVVSVMNTIPGIKASLLLVQTEDGKIKGSLRSEEGRGVDVSRIARVFGGGGHRLASGFSVDGELVREGGNWRIV